MTAQFSLQNEPALTHFKFEFLGCPIPNMINTCVQKLGGASNYEPKPAKGAKK